jgi:hypothetical protein
MLFSLPIRTPVALSRNFFFGWLWLAMAAAMLLLPAILWGRPFVFYDTPNYWGWGRDIWEALQHAWPRSGQPWPAERSLYGWELGAHGASPAELRFNLTLITARSAFYATPFYLLTRLGGLWLVAVLQAGLTAWVVKVAVRAILPDSAGLTYIGIVAVLAVASSLGFEAAYGMPDLYGGLAVLAAPILISYWPRLGPVARLGLLAVVVYAVLAHAENGLNVAAAVVIGALLHRRIDKSWTSALRRAAPTALALAISLILAATGAMVLRTAFGQPVRMAPFPASRVLADGVAQRYLHEACPRVGLAACDLADSAPADPEYYLWVYPLVRPHPAHASVPAVYDLFQFRRVTDAEVDQRERFVNEQGRLLLGALRTDGLDEARAVITRGAIAFINFGVNPDFDSLQGLLQERTQRRQQTVAITPGGIGCVRFGGAACGRFDLGQIVPWQYGMVIFSLVLLSAGMVHRPAAPMGDFGDFLLLVLSLVLANAFLCGSVSGAYDRYQARVEWLIPFCALVLAAQWLARAAPAGRRSQS